MTQEEIDEMLEFYQGDREDYDIASAARRDVPMLLRLLSTPKEPK